VIERPHKHIVATSFPHTYEMMMRPCREPQRPSKQADSLNTFTYSKSLLFAYAQQQLSYIQHSSYSMAINQQLFSTTLFNINQ
jgi:hypothetical protein